jgi:ribose transport system ATP-binding protein
MSTPEAAPLLEVRGATKSFPGVKALDDVQLDLFGGEVLALIGENGAGKSTLMKLLSGVYTPDEGEFFVDGQRVEISSPTRAEELGIAIIHQEFNLIPDLTVAQNIFIGREPMRGPLINESALNRMAQELIDDLGLSLDPRATVGSLTVASQQMVEIAKALNVKARVLIMDEPTAALNDAEVATLHALIRRFVTPETGVIYISHRMPELKAISQRITVLRDGRYVGTVATAETTLDEVIGMMVGRDIDTSRRQSPYTADGEPVLEVTGLSTRTKLRDVSLTLRRGEILGVAGLMGAGRTELARAIVGADPITSGTVSVHGTTRRISSPAAAATAGIGYLSEDRKALGVLTEQTVRDNIVLSSLPRFFRRGLSDEKGIDDVAASYAERLRIKTPSIRQYVKNLSGGNQQKVVIAKWLVRDCDILIFDEPTRGIDVGAKAEIYDLLNVLLEQGKSIIVISSELPELLAVSHRVAVMCEGRMAGVLEREEATQESIMNLATQTDSNERAVSA